MFRMFKSKKRLREENEMLRALLFKAPQIREAEIKTQTIQSSFATSHYDKDVIPEEVIKNRVAGQMAEFLKPFIKYDVMDNECGGKTYCGKLRIVDER